MSFFLDGHTGSLLLLPFGLPYAGFVSLDYEPLIPWFGVLLLGAAAGKTALSVRKMPSLIPSSRDAFYV